MIELIDHLPNNVVGIVARGRVTREECEDILRPAVEASARRHGKVRLYYEIGSRYPGAGWDELDIGASRLERIAVVSDTAWVRQFVNALRFLIAGEVRTFSREEAEEGLAWIVGPGEEKVDARGPPGPRAPRSLRARASLPGSRRAARRVPPVAQPHRHPSPADRQAH